MRRQGADGSIDGNRRRPFSARQTRRRSLCGLYTLSLFAFAFGASRDAIGAHDLRGFDVYPGSDRYVSSWLASATGDGSFPRYRPTRTAYPVLLSNSLSSRQFVDSTRKLQTDFIFRGTPGTLRAFCKCRRHTRNLRHTHLTRDPRFGI